MYDTSFCIIGVAESWVDENIFRRYFMEETGGGKLIEIDKVDIM